MVTFLRILLFSIAALSATATPGPEPYAATSIPAELLENAHAVVRESTEEFIVF